MALEGKVALVAGATRGAGRGIAIELGAAGATVYVTGRTTRQQASEYARKETIEETAELVTAAGGIGIAVQPLVIERPGGLLVEVTDGTAEYNATNYRINPFYDLAKVSVNRMAWAHAKDLAKQQATAVSLTPGWLRSEMMLEHFGVSEDNGRDATTKVPHFAISETPRFVGRAVAALTADPDRARWNGQSLSSGGLARVYGFTDLDGSRPDAWRYLVEVQDAGKPADTTGYR